MVIFKLLGIIDLICALLALIYMWVPEFMIFFAYALMLKGLIFGCMGDLFSWFDVFAGIMLFLAFKEIFVVVFFLRVVAFVLFLKGGASILRT